MNAKQPIQWGHHLANIGTVILALIWLLPLIFSILISIRPEARPITNGNIFFACSGTVGVDYECLRTLDNYNDALEIAPWGVHYINSIIFVVGVLVVQVVTVSMAGYAFARMKFPGRNILLFIILLQIMIPTGVLLVQNFATIGDLGLRDTHVAMMIPYWGSAFGVLLLRQTFREVPFELEEAARIDGANWLQIMRSVYIPLSIPAYVAFAIVSVSSHWNEFLWPFIVTRSPEVRPLTVGLNQLYNATENGARYGVLMAGTLIVIAPLIVLFLLFQRRFIESFASSGIK